MTSSSATEPAVGAYPDGYSRWFWVGLLAGWILIVAGARGLVVNASSRMPTSPLDWVLLYAKVSVLHDLVALPMVFLVGRLINRVVPARIRAVVQAGAICSAIVVVFAYPFVRGFGRKPKNPTILPQNYTHGLLIIVAIIVTATMLGAALVWRRASPPPAERSST